MPQKILKGVTITGADDRVEISDLVQLGEEFAWVEWGIVLHPNKLGKEPRYPSEGWLRELCARVDRDRNGAHIIDNPLCISAHLCGRWARRTCRGEWLFHAIYPELVPAFSRWQLNIAPYARMLDDVASFAAAMPQLPRQFIIQVGELFYVSFARQVRALQKDAAILWDRSGGRGIFDDKWPLIEADIPQGYAGGLTPDNIAEQLERLAGLRGEVLPPIWIDIETGVRTNNVFDLAKVRAVLEITKPWLREDWYAH